MSSIICLLGPTGVGKTAYISELNRCYPGQFEVVSVDSVAIYRGMDIGSAKPSLAEQHTVRYHLLDICDPAESYSAARFVIDAVAAVKDIHARGKTAVLVGGTMLYHHALLVGLSAIPSVTSAAKSRAYAVMQSGAENAYAALLAVDPILASSLASQDLQRIQRGLEVFYSSGVPLSAWQKQPRKPGLMSSLTIVLTPKCRADLHLKVANRFDSMLELGLIDEVRRLLDRDDGLVLDASYPSLRAIGYRQVYDYLHTHGDYDTMREKSIVATRRYIKRQLTWLRSWSTAHIRVSSTADMMQSVARFF